MAGVAGKSGQGRGVAGGTRTLPFIAMIQREGMVGKLCRPPPVRSVATGAVGAQQPFVQVRFGVTAGTVTGGAGVRFVLMAIGTRQGGVTAV